MPVVYTRAGGQFAASTLIEGETLRMPEIGVEIPMDDLYIGHELPPPAAQLG